MEIQRMTESDVDGVAELDKQCFAKPWSRRSFEDELKNSLAVYFVASEGSTVIGYCGFWQVAGEGDITNIAVLPGYRRRGVGGRLLGRLIDEAEALGLGSLTLEVRRSNETAKRLYRKYGFEQVGERKRYYSDNNEDAIIMMKRLKTNG